MDGPRTDRTFRSEPARRWWSSGLMLVGLFLLLAIVAVGARHPPGRATGRDAISLDLSIADTITVLLIIAAVLDVAIIAMALWKRGHVVRLPPRRRGWMIRLLAFLTGFLIIMLIISTFPRETAPTPSDEQDQVTVVEASGGTDLPWKWAILIAGLAIGGAAAWMATRQPHEEDRPFLLVPAPAHDTERPPVDEWTYEVPAGTDHRSRVIQSYAAMEAVLAARGLRRRFSEAPIEFSARTTRRRPEIAGSINTLTELFLLARFSRHDIDDNMERRASAALTEISRCSLAGTT